MADSRRRALFDNVRGRWEQRVAQREAAIRPALEVPARPELIAAGPSNFKPAHVPYGVDLAAGWAWRFLVITAAGLVILAALKFFALLVLPLVVALLLAALAMPVVGWLERIGIRRKLGALLVVVGGIAAIALLLSFVGQQVLNNIDNLSGQVVDGLEEIRRWLRTGPLHASDSQINNFIQNAQDYVQNQGKHVAGKVTEVGTAVGHIVAGLFIILFGTYFFLADGPTIWAWMVRIFPRVARVRVDTSGRVAWVSLTQFVRATVLVAATDAIGVMVWAAILGLPFISAIGVLVFLGAFVPMIGAVLAGTVAVLIALVAKGPVVALLMLAGVVVVQQIEAHILQPFLMGRFVSVHPLGVIVAITAGVVAAGVAGALIAVPFAAAVNAVVQHLASYTEVGEEPLEAAEDDPASASLLSDASGEEVADS